MQNHTKIYLRTVYPDFIDGEFLPCEVCGARLEDVHHIDARGMGGVGKKLDFIENLMGLCQFYGNHCHTRYGDKTQHMKFLYEVHMQFLEFMGAEFDRKFFEQCIAKYS